MIQILVESSVLFDYLGFGRRLILGNGSWPVSSSFVPPLTIAHIVYLKEQGLDDAEIRQQLMDRPVRAPQRHNHFPVCVLDSRFCDALPNLED